jgi:hypothetical protein
MAKDLALSARKHCGTTPRAVVTDSSDAELAALFDIVIPVDTSLGDPLFQKLCLDKYSPFDENAVHRLRQPDRRRRGLHLAGLRGTVQYLCGSETDHRVVVWSGRGHDLQGVPR